jgi:hypothetical protein
VIGTVNTLRHKSRQREGSVLMITLFIALGLGLVLASYLLMIRAQYVSVVRSQAWHSALTMAEAGVEEALAQLNSVPFTNTVPTGNGWILAADDLYQVGSPRSLLGGQYDVAYRPYMLTVPPKIYIYATGYATVPTLSATITRVVEAETIQAPLFSVGATVRGTIKLNGKNLSTDSYDSASYPYVYQDDLATGYGDVASAGGITNFGNVDIHGRFFLGATATSTGGPNFSVSNDIYNDFNADFVEIPPPFQNPDRAPEPGSNYTYVLNGYHYQTNVLNGSLYVAADAVLYVTGDANITNLDIASGASLKLYVGGGNTTLHQVDVESKLPADFQYYGLPGNSNITIIGHDKLIGTIYAPNATFQAGEGLSAFEISGAIIVDSIDMHSDFRLHFDASLKNAPADGRPVRGFVVTSWQELPPPP